MTLQSIIRTKSIRRLLDPCLFQAFFHAASSPSPLDSYDFLKGKYFPPTLQSQHLTTISDIDIIIAKVDGASDDTEAFQSLLRDQACNSIQPSHELVYKLLCRFKDDWKSALGVFRWAGSKSGYKHNPKSYDLIVDTLGKTKQMEKMRALLGEMNEVRLVTLNTIAKVMRRFAGAGKWEDATRTFDDLGTFGLEKNTESMNLLLDTLCKERKVEQARDIFYKLKLHISPSAHTFNIFIHGWCKVNRVEEAHWTIEEMKGQGFLPCVISYSTIIQFYCHHGNFEKVYEMLDEMEAQGCKPNVVTYTTFMCYLAKSEKFKEALEVSKRMELSGCKPDTLFYNSLIHILGKAGKVEEAVRLFEVEMRRNGTPPNTSTYNTMIAMFCYNSRDQMALNLLKEMENSEVCIKPDVQTYYPLLKSCLKSGKIESRLRELLDDMVNKHHLSLNLSTYALLIHGLCRANRCKWAYELFEEMVGKEIMPRYVTCRLLWDEVKLNNMNEEADKIEDFMKKL